MGYDLHITRRENWSEEGSDISAEEWLQYVSASSDLRLDAASGPHFAHWVGAEAPDGTWLDWSDGQVFSKNPAPPLIDRMVAIAAHFGATVQGDDGERYDSGAVSPRQPPVPFLTRVSGFLRRLRPAKPLRIERAPLPFGVGDRVREGVSGREATVIEIDPSGMGGLGVIRVRRDDGSEIGWAMLTHGLTLVEPGSPRGKK